MDPGAAWWDIVLVWITAFVGFYSLAVAVEGYFRRELSWMERALFLGVAIGFFFQIWWVKLAAVATLAAGVILQTRLRPTGIVTSPIKGE